MSVGLSLSLELACGSDRNISQVDLTETSHYSPSHLFSSITIAPIPLFAIDLLYCHIAMLDYDRTGFKTNLHTMIMDFLQTMHKYNEVHIN